MNVFSLGSFCEAVSGWVIMLLFIVSKLYLCDTVRWILTSTVVFVATIPMWQLQIPMNHDFDNMISGGQF